jgi:uncharacterized membrane protein
MSDERGSASATRKITRDDIEAKLRELQGEVEHRTESARSTVVAVAVGAAVVAVVAAYWFGKRRGRKRRTVFEIRRI